jgi:hypothetical protein
MKEWWGTGAHARIRAFESRVRVTGKIVLTVKRIVELRDRRRKSHSHIQTPFDLIFARAKTKDWSRNEDLNLRPPRPDKASTLPASRLSLHQTAMRAGKVC